MCPFHSSIEFRMHGRCNAEGSLVCTPAKETSVCHGQPGFCSILASCTWNTWTLEVGKFIWEIPSSKNAGTQHYCLSVLQTNARDVESSNCDLLMTCNLTKDKLNDRTWKLNTWFVMTWMTCLFILCFQFVLFSRADRICSRVKLKEMKK